MFIDGFQKASVAAAVLGLVLLASGLMINHQQNANHDDPSPPIAQPEKKPPEKKGLRMIADIRGAALVHAVAYQSVGNTLAAVYGDGSVNVWDMKKREVIKTLNRIVDISAQVAFSRDGTLLAEGREAIRVWDLETGRMVATLEGHESNVRGGGVQCLAFSPDGRWLASGGISRKFGPGMGFGGFGGKGFGGKEPQDEIKLWDLSTGQLKTTFEYKNPHSGLGHDAPIRCLAFSPEGEMLAVGGATKQGDKTTGATVGDIRFYNVQNGKEIRALKGHRYPVASVAFSPDGKMLASASADYSIKLWAVNSYKEKATLFQLSPDQEGLADVSIEFSPDGNTLASASTDNGIKTVRLWDVGTGDLKAMLKGHGGSVSSLSFHPSGTRLASGSHDTTVKEWDVMTASPTATLKEPAADFSGSVYDVVFSPDGKTIAFITNTQEAPVDSALPRTGFTIKLLDVRTGKVKATLDGPVSRLSASFGTSFRERVIPLLFSPDGKTVVTAGFEQGTGRISEKIPVILAWQTSTGKLIATFRHPVVNSGGSGAWNFLAYSPDGKKLASAAVEYTIRLWDLEAGKLRKEFPGKVQTLVFSTDGTSLITDRYTWNLKNGAKKPTFLTIPASRAIFSPDGKTAAAIIDSDLRKRSGATVVLWDLNAQKELATLRESDGTEFRCVSSAHVAFTPDGSRLLVAARGKLFDAQTGKLRTTLQGADGKPLNAYPASNSTIVFSPDSRSLIMIGAVAYSRNKGIPIWDTATGKLRKTLPGHTSYVNSAAFSPDGTLMVTGSADHTIKIWDVSALGK